MTSVSATTNTTLHNILRCVQSGEVARRRTTTGTWTLTVNGQHVTDPEIQLGVSVLDAKGCVHWWPNGYPTQFAVLTLEKGRDTVRDWDHKALLGGRRWLRLEPALLNDSCHDDGGDAA
jgi:hypothetical protein